MSLRLSNVAASYGKGLALHDVTMEVGAGEIVALIGTNGAGKSTVLRSISGLVKVVEGEISFNGRPIHCCTPKEVLTAGIAHCPEERKIWPDLSVRDHLELGAVTRRDRREIENDIEEIYNVFPILRERRSQHAGTMSGGQQQMVAIGRALMSRPKALLLDEPSLGLAPKIVEEVAAVVRRINARGTSVLIVEQNASLALEIAHRCYVLENGRITLSGPAEELRDNPAVQASYLGFAQAAEA
jgi:branched-chain amino acid transport system ATP-binding protein